MGVHRQQMPSGIRAELGAKVPYRWRPSESATTVATPPKSAKKALLTVPQLWSQTRRDLVRIAVAVAIVVIVLLITWWKLH